jgi:hypothetical protein
MRLGSLAAGALLSGGCLVAAAASPALAAFDANTVPRTTSDLVAVCSTAATDPDHADAASFCNGFVIGTVSTQIANDQVRRHGLPLFCLPEPGPTADTGTAEFVAWAKAHPDRMGDPAVDGLLRFVTETYPCAAPATRRHGTGPRRG